MRPGEASAETSRTRATEPAPRAGRPRLRFVIQKHRARSLHYDFRLEIDGVLVSWAVPKGPSKDPKVRRLAVRVPDHPIDYLLFEGTLPEGEFGAGEVIVWDFGEYELVAPEGYGAGTALRDGTLRLALRGTKVRGHWAIFRTKFAEGGRENWLLEKLRDEFAAEDYDPESEPNSALSGKVLRSRR
ncbi:MAG TPA: DNA polymerase ligase N-terminal domain-containing protein [Thermoplasmata archaeon]|nr:DNA polymerase ligase N-terminal domain-containing protein [Thermoplasmata archaeon]